MNIIGHKKIINYFNKILEHSSLHSSQTRLAHAFLFIGPESVGKMTVARWLVGKLLHRSGATEKNDSFWIRPNPDIRILQKEENKKEIAIEQVKKMREFIQQKPFIESHKIIIVENVEYMSVPAVNALLKTLEEPPGKSLLILTADYLNQIPETIISRCQVIKFKKVGYEDIKLALKNLKIQVTEEIISLADGRPGRVIDWAHNIKLFADIKTDNKKLIDLLNQDISEKFSFVELFFSKKLPLIEQSQIVSELLKKYLVIIRDVILLKAKTSGKITNTHAIKQLEKIAEKKSLKQLSDLQRKIEKNKLLINKNVNPRLVLENLFLNL